MAIDRDTSAVHSAYGARVSVARAGGIAPGDISAGRRRFAGKGYARIRAMGFGQRDYLARFCVADVSADGDASDVDGRLRQKDL